MKFARALPVAWRHDQRVAGQDVHEQEVTARGTRTPREVVALRDAYGLAGDLKLRDRCGDQRLVLVDLLVPEEDVVAVKGSRPTTSGPCEGRSYRSSVVAESPILARAGATLFPV